MPRRACLWQKVLQGTGAYSSPTGGWSGQEDGKKKKNYRDENLIGEFRE